MAEETPILRIHKNPRNIMLFFICMVFLVTVLKLASDLIIPIVFAIVLKLVLQPVLRVLDRYKIPRVVSAAGIMALLISIFVTLVFALSAPAANWIDKLPDAQTKFERQLSPIADSLAGAQKMLDQADHITSEAQKTVAVTVEGNRLSDKFFTGTQAFLSSVFAVSLLLFFLLIKGDIFLRKLVEVLPTFRNKRQAVDISQQVERDLSRYLLTITLMNILVGIAGGIVMWFCHVENPLLWGILAFILNYVPVIGPLIAAALYFFAGIMTVNTLTAAAFPAVLYLGVHLLEGTVFTPMLLAKRFTLNPVVVVLSLMIWYWMWGITGAILAMPILAIIKIASDNIAGLSALGHFLAD